jgi:NAD(P)-dependent dehydrogenase (short-subunit alcohol dehydrogenase family)
MGSLDGMVAIVTGAGRGLGRGIALALATEGASLGLLGRTLADVEQTAGEVKERGTDAFPYVCDVADRAQVDAAAGTVAERLGGIDVLVNNAQSVAIAGFVGTLNCMQACFPWLRRRPGAIVNLGSGAGIRPDPNDHGLYAAVKEAIRSLTRTAAVEWGEYGIRVNAVVPLARTGALTEWARRRPESYEHLLESVPLGRIGDCEADVGRAVAFLAGPAAGYITGSTLVVDGGQSYLR